MRTKIDPAFPEGSGRPQPLLGSIVALALMGFFPLIIVVATPAGGYAAWPGAAIIMIIAGARFGWIVGSSRRRIFEMVTWLFFYVFLGAAPMVQLRERFDPETAPNIYHEFDWPSVVIVITAEIAIIVGSFCGKFRPQMSPKDSASSENRSLSRNRVTLFTVAMLGFSAFYVARVGFTSMFASRDHRALATIAAFPDTTLAAIALAMASMGLLVSVVAQLQVRREQKFMGQKAPYLLLTLSTVVLFVCANPISTPRYVFGTVALGYLAALGIYGNLQRFRAVSVASFAGLLFLFPLLDVFRRSLDATLALESPFESFLSGDYDSFAQINNTTLFVDRFGITWGGQALGVLLFWVPRSVWAGKPIDTGILLANSRDYGFTNLSAPLPAEMYINGGWPLVVVGMLAFGFALRRWDARAELHLSSRGVPTILGCTVPFYLMIVLRGSLLQSMAFLSVILISAWFVTRWRGAGQSATQSGIYPIMATDRSSDRTTMDRSPAGTSEVEWRSRD